MNPKRCSGSSKAQQLVEETRLEVEVDRRTHLYIKNGSIFWTPHLDLHLHSRRYHKTKCIFVSSSNKRSTPSRLRRRGRCRCCFACVFPTPVFPLPCFRRYTYNTGTCWTHAEHLSSVGSWLPCARSGVRKFGTHARHVASVRSWLPGAFLGMSPQKTTHKTLQFSLSRPILPICHTQFFLYNTV